MKRLFINGRFLGDLNTAVNAVANDLSKALFASASQAGWRVSLVVPRGLEAIAKTHFDDVITVGHLNGVLWEQIELPKLRHSGTILGLFNTVPVVGSGYVTMLHDAHVFKTPGSYPKLTRAWRRALSRRAGHLGNHVLTVSEHSKSDLLNLGIGQEDRFGVVPNALGAVAKAKPDNAILERLGLSPDQAFCIGFGSLLRHKNTAFLFDAFKDPMLKNCTLVSVGGTGRDAFISAGVTPPPNVVFAGRCSDAELAALYANASTVCIPSLEEGFGLPALEAMAFGVLPIVSPCGALQEVVGPVGAVCDLDHQSWVDAIQSMTQSDITPEQQQQAKARASQFTWSASAQRVWTYLDQWYPALSPEQTGSEPSPTPSQMHS